MTVLTDNLKKQKKFFIRSQGKSMLPILQPGDIIFYKKISPSQVIINDLIVTEKGQKVFTHRVIYKNSSYFVTKGDNNLQSDDKVYPRQIIGKIYQVKRNGRFFNPEDIYLFQSTLYFQEIVRIKSLFEKENIDFVFLKGLPLYLYFKKKYPRRIYADCDLLVKEAHYEKVKEILSRENYVKEDLSRYKYFQKFVSSSLKGIEYYKKIHDFIVVLDIHLKISFSTHKFTLPIAEFNTIEKKLVADFFKNKKLVKINGISFPILNINNLIFYLLLHLSLHSFIGINRLVFIADIVADNKNKICWEKNFSQAKEYKIINFIIPGIYLLKKYFSIGKPYKLLKKKYKTSVNFALSIFNQSKNEQSIFDDAITSPFWRIKKALFVFLYYEDNAVKKLLYMLQPRLLLHFIYYFSLTIFFIYKKLLNSKYIDH